MDAINSRVDRLEDNVTKRFDSMDGKIDDIAKSVGQLVSEKKVSERGKGRWTSTITGIFAAIISAIATWFAGRH